MGFTLGEFVIAIALIGEHFRDFHQGTAGVNVFHQEQDGITHVLFKHWTTGGFEIVEFVEDLQHFVDHEGFLLWLLWIVLEHVETHWAVVVGGIEEDDVVGAFFWDKFEGVVGKVTVWVDDTDAAAFFDVLLGHGFHQLGFTGTRFTNDVGMTATITGLHADRCFVVSVLRIAKQNPFGRNIWWR